MAPCQTAFWPFASFVWVALRTKCSRKRRNVRIEIIKENFVLGCMGLRTACTAQIKHTYVMRVYFVLLLQHFEQLFNVGVTQIKHSKPISLQYQQWDLWNICSWTLLCTHTHNERWLSQSATEFLFNETLFSMSVIISLMRSNLLPNCSAANRFEMTAAKLAHKIIICIYFWLFELHRIGNLRFIQII